MGCGSCSRSYSGSLRALQTHVSRTSSRITLCLRNYANLLQRNLETELALTRHHARDLLERRAVDILMTDVTWTGGLTENRRSCDGRQHNLPFATIARTCYALGIHTSVLTV